MLSPSLNLSSSKNMAHSTNLNSPDESQERALKYIVDNPAKNVFIQGLAGSGKSYLIHCIKQEMQSLGRQLAVVAPTGIAAELVGGVTIHSMFKLGAHPYFPHNVVEQYRGYQEIVKHISTLIIDEASMLRADVFDTIDTLCKKAKGNNKAPFGGIQIVLIGDLYQLPPVYNNDEKATSYLKDTYGHENPLFFDAACYKKGNFHHEKLTGNHRQEEVDFIENLRNISQGIKLKDALTYFNKHVQHADENVPIVTAYKREAQRINDDRLSQLPGEQREFKATVSGPYYAGETGLQHIETFHVPQCLKLKIGARVMICKNGPENRYVNGSIGRVYSFGQDSISVRLDKGDLVDLKKEKWDQQEYVLNHNDQLELNTIGTFEQYPLKLAYAITIHKAQGQTWENVYIDLGQQGAFAEGQVYVALSRVKTFEGVRLRTPITQRDIKINSRVKEFFQNEENGQIPIDPEKNEPSFDEQVERIMKEVMGRRYRQSQIYYDYQHVTSSGSWTIDNHELYNDLYLVAGRRGGEQISYIFKIRGRSFKENDFAPNNQRRFNRNNPNRDNPRRRDIKINLGTCREEWLGRADFSNYLWKVIDYGNKTIESPNPDI